MKKIILLTIPLLLGIILLVGINPVKALNIPDIKIKNIQTVAEGKTYAQIQFEAKNVNSSNNQKVDIVYKRKSKEAENEYVNVYFTVQEGTNYITVDDLLPNTKYIVRFKVRNEVNNNLISSKKERFKTKKKKTIKITDVSATTVNEGDHFTIYGHGFGEASGKVTLGYGPYYLNEATILSWSPEKIEVTLPEEATDGSIRVHAFPISCMRGGSNYATYTTGPNIDVIDESHQYAGFCSSGVISNTYEEIINFNNLYKEAYGRSIKCDELEFHLQGKTNHDRLRTWLAEQDEATYWNNLKNNYNNKLIYGNYKKIYWMNNGSLYNVESFWNAASWGLLVDDAQYISDLDEGDHARINKNKLVLWKGPYYKKVMNLVKGKSASFNDDDLDDYYLEKKNLFLERDNDEEICSYIECGQIY